MLSPSYLDALPEAILPLYLQVEQDILADMARRIAAYDYWIPAAEHQRQKLREMGLAQQEIIDRLSKITGKSNAELKKLMRQAAEDTLESDRAYYRQYGMDAPDEMSRELQTILKTGYSQTRRLFKNLTKTTASAGQEQFVNALDRAWMQINSGAFDYNTAIRSAVKDLAREGLHAIKYDSGHIDTLEVAVRRATITGVNQTAGKLQWQLADEVGCDLVEVTAHAGARPSHAVWQGQIFSRSGKSDKYPDFISSTGYGTGEGLMGWNCRHSFHPYVEGAPRAYTQAMLDEYNAKKYTYNGKHYTEYEAAQIQRYHERKIRRWKREYTTMQAAEKDTYESAAKIKFWQDRQKDFVKQTGLKRQSAREQIGGYGKSEAGKVASTVKKREQAVENVRKDIRSGKYSLNVNHEKQSRHMAGNGYVEGRSCVTVSENELQKLVKQYAGTGEPKWTKNQKWSQQEIVDVGKEIGYTVNREGRRVTTSKMKIHYSKTGVHVVPYSGRS